jgi:ABC-type phosphate transport system substrate-binding protein
MRRLSFFILFLLLLNLPVSAAYSEILVIVHRSNDIETMTRRQLVDLYMGRNMNFPNGKPAFPLDQASDSQMRADFYQILVNKSLAQVNAYWARLLFTGRSTPPRPLSDNSAVLKAVRENPNAIGYIDSAELDDTVKVVARVR